MLDKRELLAPGNRRCPANCPCRCGSGKRQCGSGAGLAALAVVVLFVFPPHAPLQASDWPQLQHDAARTGYTPEEVHPPYEIAWARFFQPETVQTKVQAVAHNGLVFVGTRQGNLYALGVRDGKEAWKYAAGSAILHTAAADAGLVFVNTLDGRMHAVDAATGQRRWIYDSGFGISSAPLLMNGLVFGCNRRGRLFALNPETGAQVWIRDLDQPVLQTPAGDGRKVYVASEFCEVYALSAEDGKTVWTHDTDVGQTYGDYCPVVHKGYVIVRPMAPSGPGFISVDEGGVLTKYMWRSHDDLAEWWKGAAEIVNAGGLPPEIEEEQKNIIEYYRERPDEKTLLFLNAETGKEDFISPHFQCPNMHGPGSPPAVDKDGYLILGLMLQGVKYGRFDMGKNRFTQIFPTKISGNPDERSSPSCGGRYVYLFHIQEGNCFYSCVVDTGSAPFAVIDFPRPQGYALHDLVKLGRAHRRSPPGDPGELSANIQPGNNAVSIAEGHFFHINDQHRLCAWRTAENKEGASKP